MARQTRYIVLILVLLSIGALAVFAVPNSKASENLAMITMFEPDESVFIPVVQRMVKPQPNLVYTIGRFVAYGFYSYGFPLFAPTALIYKALTLLGQGENYPLLMLSARQIISVMPMLASLWVLVYLQDQFKSWRSIVLFIFLLSIPAVVQNGFWWHPDGLVMYFSSLVLYFLWKDKLAFGKNFYYAAVFCGILIALKVVGFFFFLTIASLLVWGLIDKKITLKQFFLKGFLFIIILTVAVVFSNPHLLIPAHRVWAFNVLKREILETSKGYGTVYDKGLSSALPVLTKFYGEAVFLLFAVGVSIRSLWDKQTRLLRVLILTWFLPLSLHLVFFSHFKYQYWLPVAVPLFSNLAFLLPDKKIDFRNKSVLLQNVLLLIIAAQFVFFIKRDFQLFTARVHRLENNPAVSFYEKTLTELEPVTQDLKIYYDYRLYLPETSGWKTETSFDLLDYDTIQSNAFDVLMLEQQRILDYIREDAVGIDPLNFPKAQQFYRDANQGALADYVLLMRNEHALLFIRQDLCPLYYDQQRCQ